MSTLFSKIIAGEIPCEKIAEDDQFFAFMDIRPISPGHVLVISKQETDRFFDLEDKLLAAVMPFAKAIALAIEKVVPCQRVGILVAGIEVPHAHVHLVPIQEIADWSFANAKPGDMAEIKSLAEKIRATL